MALITDGMVSCRKTRRNCLKLARYAYFWGRAYFYVDEPVNRMMVSLDEQPTIKELLALRTDGTTTIDEIAVMFEREIS